MAISFYPREQLYLGLSTDDKVPISGQNGAKIYYTDTLKTQICHNGIWYDYNPGVQLTSRSLKETQIGTDQDLTWANSDVVNTQKTHTFTKSAVPVEEYMLICYNPSTITDLTVKMFNVETNLKDATRDVLVTTVIIPKRQTTTGTIIESHTRIVHGIFNGGNCKIVVSNDTVLGVADGFTATFRLREVM